jgi:hypothetical protein
MLDRPAPKPRKPVTSRELVARGTCRPDRCCRPGKGRGRGPEGTATRPGSLGRPRGSLGTSKLDGKEVEIRMLLGKEVSRASIAKIVGVSRTALHHVIRTRKLDPKESNGRTRGWWRLNRSFRFLLAFDPSKSCP